MGCSLTDEGGRWLKADQTVSAQGYETAGTTFNLCRKYWLTPLGPLVSSSGRSTDSVADASRESEPRQGGQDSACSSSSSSFDGHALAHVTSAHLPSPMATLSLSTSLSSDTSVTDDSSDDVSDNAEAGVENDALRSDGAERGVPGAGVFYDGAGAGDGSDAGRSSHRERAKVAALEAPSGHSLAVMAAQLAESLRLCAAFGVLSEEAEGRILRRADAMVAAAATTVDTAAAAVPTVGNGNEDTKGTTSLKSHTEVGARST